MTQDHVRIRHYTSRGRMDRIEREAIIRTGSRGSVFCESARRRPLSRRDIEDLYRLRKGRGRDYVEVDVPAAWVSREVNSSTGVEEWRVRQDILLDDSATIVRRT